MDKTDWMMACVILLIIGLLALVMSGTIRVIS